MYMSNIFEILNDYHNTVFNRLNKLKNRCEKFDSEIVKKKEDKIKIQAELSLLFVRLSSVIESMVKRLNNNEDHMTIIKDAETAYRSIIEHSYMLTHYIIENTENRKTFYSQQGEDVYIYNNFINKVCPDGVFVELGAYDGLNYSNTKFFEDELKMSGILIEPSSSFTLLLKNRPNCKCYNVAINTKKEKVKFMGEWVTAGLVDTMHESFKNIWHKDSTEYYVDAEPISDIFERENVEYIDFISIDVEGGEEVVLKTMNFKIPTYVICIELDGHNLDKDEVCRQMLLDNGFTFNKRININEFWINENYYRKELLYDETRDKLKFMLSINEIGDFKHLENHIIEEVENAL